jgi:2-polyprenyl-3-methyl-5-hydroxy-6-metoxy-1,4-benzoquinol methylase
VRTQNKVIDALCGVLTAQKYSTKSCLCNIQQKYNTFKKIRDFECLQIVFQTNFAPLFYSKNTFLTFTPLRDLTHYQAQYEKQPYEQYQVYFRKKMLLERLETLRPARILEIGCGLEPLFCVYSDFEQLDILEPADLFYENALRLQEAQARPSSIRIHQCLLENSLPLLQNKSFDLIICACLLHEIQDQRAFLTCIKELASADTRIHINVPNVRSFHRLLAVEMGLIKDEFQPSDSQKLFQQNRFFDAQGLRSLIEEVGFEILDSGSYTLKLFTHEQMDKGMKMGLLSLEMLEGMNRMVKLMPEMGSEIFVEARLKS